MTLSRTKFIILFIVFGFAFFFITTSLLGSTGVRGFPQQPDSVLWTGADSEIPWKVATATILVPIKAVLLGPLAFPSVTFLKDDPPPPFVGIFFVLYWAILASLMYSLIRAVKRG